MAQLLGTGGDNPLGSFTFTSVRFLIGAVALLPVAMFFRARAKSGAGGGSGEKDLRVTVKAGAICGAILYVASCSQQFGIVITNSAGKAGFITGLYIVLVPLVGSFFGRVPGLLTWIGAFFCCGGLYFLSVSESDGAFGIGDIVLLVGALMWTAHILVVDRYGGRIDPLFMSLTQFVVCGTLSGVSALIFERTTLAQLTAVALPVLYCGVVSVGIAYTLQIIGQRHVKPAKAAIIFSLEAVFAAITAYFVVHETLSVRGYFGCGLIFAGILLAQVPAKQSKQSKQADKIT
ncbi:transporter [Clostridia bacterium]|nr:transporter [Clostridia bacterium]